MNQSNYYICLPFHDLLLDHFALLCSLFSYLVSRILSWKCSFCRLRYVNAFAFSNFYRYFYCYCCVCVWSTVYSLYNWMLVACVSRYIYKNGLCHTFAIIFHFVHESKFLFSPFSASFTFFIVIITSIVCFCSFCTYSECQSPNILFDLIFVFVCGNLSDPLYVVSDSQCSQMFHIHIL